MKPLGKIVVGDYYLEPWSWDKDHGSYTRYFKRCDEDDTTDEEMIECLKSAGVDPDSNITKYSQMEEVDSLLKAYSKRLKKVKAFQ